MNKMTDLKKYNIFLLLSTFGRNMIEVFIPTYLYKQGFGLNEIFFYFALMLFFSLIVCIPATYLANKIKYKYLMIISTLFLIITYFMLVNVTLNITYLIALAFYYAMYKRFYFIVKRYYELNVISKNNMATKVSYVIIIMQMASMLSVYLGGIILSSNNKVLLFIISIVFYMLSIVPLIKINLKQKEKFKYKKIELKKIKINNFILMILNEAIFVASFAFPLYMFIYIKNNFSYMGLFNLFVGVSSMITVYLVSIKMDKDKNDYKYIASIFIFIIFVLKLNFNGSNIFLLLGLLEGIFLKLYDLAYTRNVYYLGNKFNLASYNLFIEIIQNVSRLIMFLIIFLITKDLKTMILICSLLIFVTTFIKFDDGIGGYK